MHIWVYCENWRDIIMPKVSVIIPVYRVEKYIERCARSLFEQSLGDIEYIFINDCTPDKSIEVLNEVIESYPNRREQIRIEIMPQNSGLPRVRKRGVQLATGDYIIACDSDDYVEKDMYRSMYELAMSKDLDLVQCDIDVVDDEKVLSTFTTPVKEPKSEQLRELIINGEISNSLCNKLIKREIYHNEGITFPAVGMDEDNTLSIQLAYFSKKLGYINSSFYKAYQNPASMSRVPGDEQIERRYNESLQNSKLSIAFLSDKGYAANSKAVIKAKLRPKMMLLPVVRKRKYVKLWKETYPEINRISVCSGKLSRNMRIKSLLVQLYLFPLFERIRK